MLPAIFTVPVSSSLLMQWVHVAAHLLNWVDYKPDLSDLGMRGDLPLTPADHRKICRVIKRKSTRRGRHWRAFLQDMKQPHKLGDWESVWQEDDKGNALDIRHCCYACK